MRYIAIVLTVLILVGFIAKYAFEREYKCVDNRVVFKYPDMKYWTRTDEKCETDEYVASRK